MSDADADADAGDESTDADRWSRVRYLLVGAAANPAERESDGATDDSE